MKNFILKYEIWIFLFVAPILNTFITYLNSKEIVTGFVYTHGRFYALLLWLICIVKLTKGFEGVKDMFRPMLNWKVNPFWYVFGLIFALSIASLTLLLKGIYYGGNYFQFFELSFPTIRNSFFLLTWAFVGEVVWVSYAVRELAKSMKPFYASQIVGIFWTLWWIPSVLINIGVINDIPVWPLFFNMMGAAGMCAIVYQKTKSGICVLILQFMLNMSAFILPVSPSVGGQETYTVFAVIYFTVMVGIWLFMKPQGKLEIEEKNEDD